MLEITILIALHNMFSQYFEICSSKITAAILRSYCLISTIFAVYYSIKYLSYLFVYDIKGNLYNSLITIEFIIWYLTGQFTSQTYLTIYTRTILTCDSNMGYPQKIIEIKYIFMFMLFCIILSVISLFSDLFLSKYWDDMIFEDKYNLFVLISQWFMMQSAELSNFRTFIVVGLLQNRIMLLRTTLENNNIRTEIVEQEEIQSKIKVIRKCVLNYRNLLDAFNSIAGHINYNMFLILLIAIPHLIMYEYTLIKQIIFKQFFKRIVFVDAIRCLMKITAPCIICELCYKEVHRLMELLMKQIIQSSDAVLRDELQRALDFVSRRPFSFTLLSAVRVDIQLPVAICALSITYVILLIEFTHFVL